MLMTRCWLALGSVVALASVGRCVEEAPPFDLRYLATVHSSLGCYPIRDHLLINPSNLAENGLAWIGSKENPTAEIVYAAKIDSTEAVVYDAVMHLKIVDYGERLHPTVTVQVSGPDGNEVGSANIRVTGGYQVCRTRFQARQPGEYRARLRVEGPEYFAGAAAQACYLTPRLIRPATREERLAAHGLIEARTTFTGAASVLGDVRQANDDRLFGTHSGGPNALSWSYEGFEQHRFGVRWAFPVEAPPDAAQGRIGVQLYWPRGTAKLTIEEPTGGTSSATIYGSPEVRTLWFPVGLQAGQYSVTLMDENIGRTECSVLKELMLAR